ncbi:MAG: hypothetical protein ABSG46_09420 [Candidatus Binataceae bacterium]
MRYFGLRAAAGAALMLALAAGRGMAQNLPTPGPNQTLGYGNGKIVEFTYTENFDCVDEPNEDLNFNGILAEVDPSELYIPICQAANEPAFDPTGAKVQHTDKLYVLIPMFSENSDTTPGDALPCPANPVPGEVCGPALGTFLIDAFGSIPEGFRTIPEVSVQCPNPTDPPGSCTMHGDTIDLSLVLASLGLAPNLPTGNIFVPLPNHSHLIFQDRSQKTPQWWQVLPVLIENASDWPSADGASGITTIKALETAENDKDAIEAPSNFFLFFGSQIIKTAKR